MRFKYPIIAFLIAIVGTTTMTVTGQEEPLPAIQAKGSSEPIAFTVALATEPIRDSIGTVQPTLADAVRANDYAAFELLYRDAARHGQPVAAFTALHELWTYSVTDPIGAFYGADLYARYTRAYPGYARYIDQYRIVDRNGNVFYPTSETRAFLLTQALEGRAPQVHVAERSTSSTTEVAQQRSGAPASSPAGPAASRRRPSRRAHTQAPVSASKNVPVSKPVPATKNAPAPAQTAARDASAPRATGAGTPKAPIVAVKKAVVEPVAIAQAPVVTEAPVVVKAEPQPAPVPVTVPPAVVNKPLDKPLDKPADNNLGTRGILLLLIGIVGIGLLAMMLRTPRELPPSIMAPPAASDAVPPPAANAPVEPLRRPAAAPQPDPPTGKNRASGSHG